MLLKEKDEVFYFILNKITNYTFLILSKIKFDFIFIFIYFILVSFYFCSM